MKSLLWSAVILILIFVVVKASTRGWRRRKGPSMKPAVSDTGLSELLRSHVYRLSHEIGDRNLFEYAKLDEAATYIAGEFEAYGYRVELEEYPVLGQTAKNIIARKVGTGKPDEVIIVGAHYDTCYNPGADDNASAVAGLLELARSFAGEETGRTIKFIAFANEEPPFFKSEKMGSRVYAENARARGEKIEAALILEMIGYYSNEPNSQKYPPLFGLFFPNRADFICVVGSLRFRSLVKKVGSIFREHSDFPIETVAAPSFVPGIDFSDHWSFWREDYPAVMITDTAFYRYAHYHQPTDTYEKLDYESMAAVVEGLKYVVSELAD